MASDAATNPLSNVEAATRGLNDYLSDAGFEATLKKDILAMAYVGLLKRARKENNQTAKRVARANLQLKQELKKKAQLARVQQKSPVSKLREKTKAQAAGRTIVR